MNELHDLLVNGSIEDLIIAAICGAIVIRIIIAIISDK